MAKILIWGGTGGIGSATARALSEQGRDLHLAGRDQAKLEALAQELGCSTSCADVLEDGAIARATQEAGAPLAGLVYAVGSINLKPLGRLSPDDFLRDFHLNAMAAAQAVQAALPALRAADGGASVVLFSSIAVAQGFAAHASVSMAKGAIEGLTRALGAELAPQIRVNAIAPSLVRTRLAQGILANEQMASSIAKMHPLNRLGTPEDIGELAAFLISEKSGWMSGQVIGVDGGRAHLRPKG